MTNITPGECVTPIPDFHLDRTLYTGRPANPAGRLNKEIHTYDLLDKLGITYQRLDHDPTATIEACHDIDTLLNTNICKNLFLRNAQKNCFYLLMISGHKKFKNPHLEHYRNFLTLHQPRLHSGRSARRSELEIPPYHFPHLTARCAKNGRVFHAAIFSYPYSNPLFTSLLLVYSSYQAIRFFPSCFARYIA